MNHREHNLARLAAHLARHPGVGPAHVPQDALTLQRISRSLSNIAKADCNEGESARRNAREARLQETARVIAAYYGLSVYHQGDPRGPALYLYDIADLAGRDIQSVYDSIGVAVASQ